MAKNDRAYSNGEITVFWKPSKCVHSTICFSQLPNVFDPLRRPWVNIHGAATAEIIRTVEDCPSGALVYKRNEDLTEAEKMCLERRVSANTKEEDVSTEVVEIRMSKRGPYHVSGAFRLVSAAGELMPQKDDVFLCSCGKTKNSPFCDSSHNL